MPIKKFTLHKDRKDDSWRHEQEGSNRAVKKYETKNEAVKDLKNAVGRDGGSVRIRKIDNTIQEERTYPGSKDPRASKG